MQSGRGKTRDWVIEFMPETRVIEPLMGWTATTDTRQQVKLRFPTREEAVAYCETNGIPYQVAEPAAAERHKQSYSDNFAFKRVDRWTH